MARGPTEQEIYLTDLRYAISRRTCILMVGYGLTSLVSTKDKAFPRRPPRTCTDMLQEMASQCYQRGLIRVEAEREEFKKLLASKAFSKAGEMIERWQPDKLKQQEYLMDMLLCDPTLTIECQTQRLIARIPFRGYLTTTHDMYIETAYNQVRSLRLTKFDYTQIEDANKHKVNTKNPFVLKLYGDVFTPLLITFSDFDFKKRLSSENRELKSKWGRLLDGAPILFVGFEKDNPGFQCIEYFFEQKLFDTSIHHWLAVSRNLDKDSKVLFNTLTAKYKNVHIIQYDSDLDELLTSKKREGRKKTVQSEAISPPIEIFIVHTNATADKTIIKYFNVHLSSLGHMPITISSIQDFRGGDDRQSSIEERLASANIILLLVSPDFLIDSECQALKQQAMNRRNNEPEERKPRVIPIILRKCLWESEPLAGLQPLPSDKKPIDQQGNRDEILNKIAEEIQKEIQKVVMIRRSAAISPASKKRSSDKSAPY